MPVGQGHRFDLIVVTYSPSRQFAVGSALDLEGASGTRQLWRRDGREARRTGILLPVWQDQMARPHGNDAWRVAAGGVARGLAVE